jgi:hypothetical protein
MVGIPNVGKSAIVSAMHQIGRIATAGDVRWSFVAALLFVLASVLVGFLYIFKSQWSLSFQRRGSSSMRL